MTSIEERVKAVVTERLSCESDAVVREASFFDDLGADSLDTVELVMALEEEFDTEIPDADSQKILTVGDAIDYIKEKGIE